MADDVINAADGKARSPLSARPRKLIYGLSLTIVYAVLIFVSYGYRDFLVFFLGCLGVSFLPLFGLLPSLWRTFVMLAVALLLRLELRSRGHDPDH